MEGAPMSLLPIVEPKDPSEVKFYTMDWTLTLNTGATISTSSWTVESGLTKDSDAIVSGNKKTTILVSGGTDGVDYKATNQITTSDGETLERTGLIPVRSL
jgi:hypothetical protein